ncbi:MAG: hypothetical protein CVU56_06315 [Deltaproteobacteria bacterium HGW-Deltaproteobacteria-14]|jgi:hypothetical protein|nr:MAG: hypothetical protein CVU56_06315 [Deltaproteobacteria bacterium HGW-Deltaproteobacteria-14]
MREPWQGDWCPAPNFRVHVRLIPVLRVRYDLHVQFPAGNTLHPLSGVDVVMPRLTWEEVIDFFTVHGMTGGWAPKPPTPADLKRQVGDRSLQLAARPRAGRGGRWSPTSRAAAGAPAPVAV